MTAWPLASVTELAVGNWEPPANAPPLVLLVQTTVLPDVGTGLLFASANWAVTRTKLPATTFDELGVTRYLVAVAEETMTVRRFAPAALMVPSVTAMFAVSI